MSMMPRHRIQEHNDAQPYANIVQFLTVQATQAGIEIPDLVYGIVKAELYRGLWIVRCPAEGCYGAVAVCSTNPIYMCPDCGAGWFRVEFPKNREAIEDEVMKRPVTVKGLTHANWSPYGGRTRDGKPTGGPETMPQLRRQTKQKANV